MGHTVDALRPSALTDALRDSTATGGRRVLDVQRRPLGAGQVASCVELVLSLEGGELVTLVAKLPSEDPVSLATAAAQHLYEREVRFYREVAPTVRIRTPVCHAASFDSDTGRFVLLLESLCPAAVADQLEGLDVARCALALEELAGLHAPHWGTDGPAALSFFEKVGADLAPLYAEVVPALFGGFLERHGDALSAPARAVVEWLAPRLGWYLGRDAGPRTVVHGDFRTDNLLFDGCGGVVPMATVDWQTVALGPAALDVAYLLTTSLEPEVRRRVEGELLERYLERLRSLEVVGYGLVQLQEDYARHAFQGIVMLVCASMIVERTERGDAMFLTMIERIATAVDDLDARTRLAA